MPPEPGQLRLTAEVSIPAELAMRVQTLLAAGDAAAIAAQGEAASQALAHLQDAWRESGKDAMNLVAMQHLDEVFTKITSAAANVHAKLRIIHAWCARTSPERIAR